MVSKSKVLSSARRGLDGTRIGGRQAEARGNRRGVHGPSRFGGCLGLPGRRRAGLAHVEGDSSRLHGRLPRGMGGSVAQSTDFTMPMNLAGTPAICLPCGFSGEGLPRSIQFAGRRLSEPVLCRITHAYEQATRWHLRHPSADTEDLAEYQDLA